MRWPATARDSVYFIVILTNLHNSVQRIASQISKADSRSASKTTSSELHLLSNGHFDLTTFPKRAEPFVGLTLSMIGEKMEAMNNLSTSEPTMYMDPAPKLANTDSWNWALALTVLLVFAVTGTLCVCLRLRVRKYIAKVKEQEIAKKAAHRTGQSEQCN